MVLNDGEELEFKKMMTKTLNFLKSDHGHLTKAIGFVEQLCSVPQPPPPLPFKFLRTQSFRGDDALPTFEPVGECQPHRLRVVFRRPR